MVVFAGDVSLPFSSHVGKDVIINGGSVALDGTIDGDLIVNGGDVRINGLVKGDVKVKAASFSLGPEASIQGNLEYKSSDRIDESKVEGQTTFTQYRKRERSAFITQLGGRIKFALMLLIVGLVMLYFGPEFSEKTRHHMLDRPVKAILLGFAVLVGVPIASLILMITIIGIPFSLIIFALYGIGLFLSLVYGAYIAGHIVDRKLLNKDLSPGWEMVLGAFVFSLVVWIPFIGGIILFVTMLAGLGALTLDLFGHERKKPRKRRRRKKK